MHSVKTKTKRILIAIIFILIASISHVTSAATYYVANDGSNEKNGMSRETAWQTVSHASEMVVAGDTVLIAGGTYHESVQIRATGEIGRPITFKSMPGEKVIFDGVERTLEYAFLASYKSHLRFDGLYFTGYSYRTKLALPWSDRIPGNGDCAAIVLYHTHDVQVTRCFSDGRGPGYSGGLVIARNCNNLLVRNSVMISAMGGGLYILYAPNARVENNVFLVNLIYATIYQNNDHEPATLVRNIITDNIQAKQHVKLLYNTDIVDAQTHTNCYFLRTMDEDHPWQKYGTIQKWMAHVEATYKHDQSMKQVIDDPVFKATVGAKPIARDGKPMFLGDYLLEKEDLDFNDLFATNPELIRRNIGLDPEAFKDFHFNTKSTDAD